MESAVDKTHHPQGIRRKVGGSCWAFAGEGELRGGVGGGGGGVCWGRRGWSLLSTKYTILKAYDGRCAEAAGCLQEWGDAGRRLGTAGEGASGDVFLAMLSQAHTNTWKWTGEAGQALGGVVVAAVVDALRRVVSRKPYRRPPSPIPQTDCLAVTELRSSVLAFTLPLP